MQLSIKTRVCLVSAVAAAVLAACGGGSTPEAQSPQSAALSPQSADVSVTDSTQLASTPAAKTPLTTQQADPDRKMPLGVRDAPGNLWIVQMAEPPAAAYEGTRPAAGEKFDSTSSAVHSYRAMLASKHDAVVKAVGAKRKVYSYGTVLNAFAAEMTDEQAKKAMQMKGVVAVTRDHLRQVADPSTPTFLGLTGPNGFYAKTGAKGDGVVIGMVDTGIWAENPAFSDHLNGQTYRPMTSFKGTCDKGTDTSFPFPGCNNKLIGARYFNAGWGGDAAIQYYFPEEFLSPRDFAGHGSHTSSTAGGNEATPISGPLAGYGTINGMAPHARIAMYKVCWGSEALHTSGVLPGCTDTDSVAAIEQAVSDGVDVINFSISGTATDFLDPVEQAFMNAAKAGVFVAAAAGNSGPTESTVNHPSPWLTTVAAGTHNRTAVTSLTLGGNSYTGPSTMVPGQVVSGLITTGDASVAGGANVALAQKCYGAADNGGNATLDPAKVNGKIVVCDRGTIGFANKALAVAQAGGIGVVFVNVPGGSTEIGPPPALVLPGMKIAVASRDAIRAYAGPSNASASITVNLVFDTPAPFTAGFSSRGPSLASQGNILKPDIMAPGVDVIAAVAPTIDNQGQSFASYQGTSMATPHIAGIAALFKQVYPKWSPMAIKSAMMTTAYDILDGPDTNPFVVFRQGAGHVNPVAALDPGLVFDSSFTDWAGFMCGQYVVASTYCTSQHIPVIDPVNMNLASIAVGTLAGSQTITRRVTNVSGHASTYTPSLSGLEGFNVKVSPAKLALSPLQTKSFTVTISSLSGGPLTAAGASSYSAGQLTWSDGKHNVRVPVVVQPVVFAAPPDVIGSSYNVKFGYNGPFQVSVLGPAPGVKQTSTISMNTETDFFVNIPEGTVLAKFQTFVEEFPAGTDVDMVVLDPNGNVVGVSQGPTAGESVTVESPMPGRWRIAMLGFSIASKSIPINVYSWAVPDAQSSFATVKAPKTATLGTQGAISIALNKSAPAGRYMGFTVYGGADGVGGFTSFNFTK